MASQTKIHTTLPHSAETERSVLAIVLLSPSAFADLDVDDSCFYLERHRLFWASMVALDVEGKPVDARTLQTQMEEAGTFNDAGGLVALTELDLDLPDIHRADVYTSILRRLADRRRLIKLAGRLGQSAHEGGDARELAARYRRLFEDIEGGASVTTAGQWGSELVADFVADAAARRKQREETGKPTMGLPTGIPKLDDYLCGLSRGLYLLAGPPGVGKTSFAVQVAMHVARTSPVIYATYENAASNLIGKAVCAAGDIDPGYVARGYGDPEKLRVTATGLAPQLERIQLVDGDASLTVGRLRAIARRAIERHGAKRGLIVVDYLQLMAKISRELRTLTDVRSKVDALGGELIALSKRLDSPIVAISSQSRTGGGYGSGGGRAALDSLKESGDLEYAADCALFLTPPEGGTLATASDHSKLLDLTIRKNRHGPAGGVVPLVWRPDRGTFREVDKRRA